KSVRSVRRLPSFPTRRSSDLRFERDPARHWAAYVAGVFLVLMREREFNFQDGARILIASRVPQGKGVSSSAALEVAVMQAVAARSEEHTSNSSHVSISYAVFC